MSSALESQPVGILGEISSYGPQDKAMVERLAERLLSSKNSRRGFLRQIGGLAGAILLSQLPFPQQPSRAEASKSSNEFSPGGLLEQTSVRCLGGIHILTTDSLSQVLARFYTQEAWEMATRVTSRVDSRYLQWAFLEIKTKIERANRGRNPNFDSHQLRQGDRLLLPPDESLRVFSLVVPTNLMPIEVVVRGCDTDCGDSIVGWMYGNRPRVVRVHGFEAPGEAIKAMSLGMRGTILGPGNLGSLGKPLLGFKVVEKRVQSSREYIYGNSPGSLLAGEDLQNARIISCETPDGNKVLALKVKLSLPMIT